MSPELYRRQPAELRRLRPWIRRDLQLFLGAPEAELVLRVAEALLPRHHSQSSQFIESLRPYLARRAEHFAHELLGFTRSPYSVERYDEHVVYGIPPPAADEAA